MFNRLPDDMLDAMVTVSPLSDILLSPTVVLLVHFVTLLVVPLPATAPPAAVNISNKFTPADKILLCASISLALKFPCALI